MKIKKIIGWVILLSFMLAVFMHAEYVGYKSAGIEGLLVLPILLIISMLLAWEIWIVAK